MRVPRTAISRPSAGSLRAPGAPSGGGCAHELRPRASGRKCGGRRGGASPGSMERASVATRGGYVPGFLLALQTKSGAEAPRALVQEQELRQWGLTGQWPRADIPRLHPGLANSVGLPSLGPGTARRERSCGAVGGLAWGFFTYGR